MTEEIRQLFRALIEALEKRQRNRHNYNSRDGGINK